MSKSRRELLPPTGYKGGKRRFAPLIATRILATCPSHVYDVCAGSGAVFLALIEAGLSPKSITAVEAGPWGLFWAEVASGTFALSRLKRLLTNLPPAPEVKAWLEETVAHEGHTTVAFLLLQAGAYGSAPVWWDGAAWRRGDAAAGRGYSARSFWEPGPASKETKPRGTIFQPMKIVERVEAAMEACRGMTVIHGRAENVDWRREAGTATYVDPPYAQGSGYGFTLDLSLLIREAPRPLFVSEGRPLEDADESIAIGERRGAGVSKRAGRASNRAPEYLSVWGKSNQVDRQGGLGQRRLPSTRA